MMTVLHQLKTHHERREKPRPFRALAFTVVVVGLLTLTTWKAVEAWVDYAFAVPLPGTVRAFHRGWDEGNRTREYDFGICRYTVVDRRHESAAWLCRLFGANAPELDNVSEGETVTLWMLPMSGRATPALRVPIATTIVPLLYLGILLIPRRRIPRELPETTTEELRVHQDGSTELRVASHRCFACAFLESTLLLPLFAALMLLAAGTVAPLFATLMLSAGVELPFLNGESTLRECLALIAAAGLLVPILTAALLLGKGPSVRWNDSTVWVHGVRFQRAAIRRVALRPLNGDAVLDIRTEGARSSASFVREAVWMAGVLERLGYEIEFSEKPIVPAT